MEVRQHGILRIKLCIDACSLESLPHDPRDHPCSPIAIHRAAGPELVEECRRVPLVEKAPGVRPLVRCPTGEARITRCV